MNPDITAYNMNLDDTNQQICDILAMAINQAFPDAESKIWHGNPVWFLNWNPIVWYDKQIFCIRLLFWSGQSFEIEWLLPTGKFKAAEARYTSVDQINRESLKGRFEQARNIQRDYKNIVKRKGVLERLK